MSVTATTAARGTSSPLTFSHTSTADRLIVVVSTHQSGSHTSVTFNGVALTLGDAVTPIASNGVSSDPISWWYLDAPDVGAHNVVVTTSGQDSRGISAAANNVNGWPTNAADILFSSEGGRQNLTHPALAVTSSAGAEVIDWLSYNDALQVTTPAAGQSQLWDQDGGAGALNQRSSGSSQPGAASVLMAWNMTTGGDYWSHGVLTFVVAASVPITYEDPCTIEQPEMFATVDTGTEIVKAGIKGFRHSAALGGYAEPRLLTMGDIVRASSDPATGAFPAQSVRMEWADTDKENRARSSARFGLRNSDVAVYLTSRAQAQADGPPRLLMAGKVRANAHDANLVEGFDINDLISISYSLFAEEKQIPQRQIDRNWFPNCPEASVGLGEPIIGGTRKPLSPDNTSSDTSRHEGVVPGILVGRMNVGGSFGTPTAVTLADVVAAFNVSGAAGTIYQDWGGTIGWGDAPILQNYYDSNGTVPTDYDGLAQIIGYSDLDYLLAQTTVSGGTDFVAVMIAGHAIKSILDGGNGDPSIWIDDTQIPGADIGASVFIDLSRDITGSDGNVRRYALIRFSAGSGHGDAVEAGGRVHVDCEGFEDVGDSSGVLIEDCYAQYKHLMKNFFLGDYQSGSWLAGPTFTFADGLTILDRVDEASFDAASAIAAANLDGGYIGSFTLGTRASIRDVITKCNSSWGCLLAQDDYQRLFIKVLTTNRSDFYTNRTGSVHRVLKDKTDFLPGFSLEPKPDWQVNRLFYQYAKHDYAGSFERGAGGGGTSMKLDFLAGQATDDVITKTLVLDFVRDDGSAQALAQAYLDLFCRLPYIAHYGRRGLCSLEDDVLDGVPINHYNFTVVNAADGDAFWILSKTYVNYHCEYLALMVEPLFTALENPQPTALALDPVALRILVADNDSTKILVPDA